MYRLQYKNIYKCTIHNNNIVFIELKKQELENDISSIFYFKNTQGKEVDFVIKEGLKVKQLVQVTYASSEDEIEKREIKSERVIKM
ncbi:MAG: hypothetical protein ACP5FX_00650 [Candidatus Micrarchaeia archaeon]